MKRYVIFSVLAALLLAVKMLPSWAQSLGTPVEGIVTQEGKAVADVQVTITNTDTSKIYKTKTDKNGGFAFLGIPYGNYQVDVIGENGEKLFTQRTVIGTSDTSSMNALKIDLRKGGAPANDKFGVGTPPAPTPKLTKEQLAKIKADNDKIAGLNSLINDAQAARQAQDWPKAENALKQLIAAVPDTTRWDLYWALGDAQSHSNKPQDAVQTYDKGVQIAQTIISGAMPPDPKNPNSTPAAAKSGSIRMLTSQGNAYLKLQKPDEAITALKKAVELDPGMALSLYNLCGVEFSAGKYDEAKQACGKYLQLEPGGAHADEVKAFIAQMGAK